MGGKQLLQVAWHVKKGCFFRRLSAKMQTWVGYISQKIYIPEYIRFEDIFTGYNIIVKNRIYDRDILGLITKYILYPFSLSFFVLFCIFGKNIWPRTHKKNMFRRQMVAGEEHVQNITISLKFISIFVHLFAKPPS